MTGKKFIQENLKKVLSSLGVKNVELEIKISDNPSNGDYYTNVAMRLSSNLKKNPLEIAHELKDKFEKSTSGIRSIKGVNDNIIKHVEVAAPGFVNFFLSQQVLEDTVKTVSEHEKFGDSDTLKNQKIMVEFTDPNPFKAFHIGHLYSNVVGESLSRLIESQGASVRRVCYQGDVGLHVAKAIYGMKSLATEIPDDESSLSIRAQYLGKAYAFGAKKYDLPATPSQGSGLRGGRENNVKEEINNLNKKIYDASDEDVNALYVKGKSWSLEYFDSIYARLGTKFDNFYFESGVGPIGLELVREYLKKNVFEESEGAVIFPGKKFGLHNRVFINSLGLPTYEAKDMGLAPTKYKDFAYDKSIIITAEEQSEYFKVVLKALEQIDPDLTKKTLHLAHGMIRLPSGKMSSRTGDVITGEWLMDEVVSRIHTTYSDMEDALAEKVGLAAIKFAFLKVGIGHDIEFNIEESISLSGASGPYIQYAYVRTRALLAKNHEAHSTNSGQAGIMNHGEKVNDERRTNNEELALMRQLVYFPEIVATAAEKYSPSLVAEYLLELSQKFNNFYQKHQVVGDENRIKLTTAVGNVLAHGLNLLGIETVERM